MAKKNDNTSSGNSGGKPAGGIEPESTAGSNDTTGTVDRALPDVGNGSTGNEGESGTHSYTLESIGIKTDSDGSASSGNGSGGNSGGNSGGIDGDSGGTGSGGNEPRKRGRPRGSRNRVRTAGGIGESGTPIEEEGDTAQNTIRIDPPENVPYGRVIDIETGKRRGPGRPKKEDSSNPELLKDFLTATFKVPDYLGWGDHWPLNNTEANDLTKAIKTAYRAMPEKSRKAVGKYLEIYAPFMVLLITSSAILYPRIVITLAEGNEKYNESPVQNEGSTATQGARGSGATAGIRPVPNPSNAESIRAVENGSVAASLQGSPRAMYYSNQQFQ